MASELLMQPRLVGRRFEGGVVPLEILADFTVLGEMIIEVARWKFLSEKTNRKRLPRGFNNGISLKLTGIESGSAKLGITLFFASLVPTDAVAYIMDARDAIVGAIRAAEQRTRVEDHLPTELLSYFDRFGRSLGESESIEFGGSDGTTEATLTWRTRRALALASANEVAYDMVVYGSIHEADQKASTFKMQLIDGTIHHAKFEKQHRSQVLEAFMSYHKKDGRLRVRVSGVGRYSRENKLEGIESVEHVSILEPLDVGARAEELKLLKAGWMDGYGKPVDPGGLDWLSKAFSEFYPVELGFPYLYPTIEGNARFEWSIGSFSVSLDVNLTDHMGAWHVLNLSNDQEAEKSVDLNSAAGWEWVATEIKRMTGESPA